MRGGFADFFGGVLDLGISGCSWRGGFRLYTEEIFNFDNSCCDEVGLFPAAAFEKIAERSADVVRVLTDDAGCRRNIAVVVFNADFSHNAFEAVVFFLAVIFCVFLVFEVCVVVE